MSDPIHSVSKSSVWYRRMMNTLWMMSLFTLGFELIRLIAGQLAMDDIPHYFLQQGGLLILMMGIAEGISLIKSLRSDYTLILAANSLSATILGFHPEVPNMPAILLISLSASVLFFQVSRVAVSGLQSGFNYAVLLLTSDSFRESASPTSICIIFAFLISACAIALLIVSRGREILHNLQHASSAHQDLLVKSIIMDKLFKMDALTELYNHKTFHEYLEKLIEQSERNGLPLHLAIVDLDHFKKVNDTYGHHVGDIVLMRTASFLRNAVTPDDFVARYGGEEFAIIFTDKTLKQCSAMMEKVRSDMENYRHEELGFRTVTCSIGLEAYMRGTGKDYFFKMADDSLYAAKKRGRNQIASTSLLFMEPPEAACN